MQDYSYKYCKSLFFTMCVHFFHISTIPFCLCLKKIINIITNGVTVCRFSSTFLSFLTSPIAFEHHGAQLYELTFGPLKAALFPSVTSFSVRLGLGWKTCNGARYAAPTHDIPSREPVYQKRQSKLSQQYFYTFLTFLYFL